MRAYDVTPCASVSMCIAHVGGTLGADVRIFATVITCCCLASGLVQGNNSHGSKCSYLPQTEQHEPERQNVFRLGNVTYLLDVTPSNPLPHPLSPPFSVFQVQMSHNEQYYTRWIKILSYKLSISLRLCSVCDLE